MLRTRSLVSFSSILAGLACEEIQSIPDFFAFAHSELNPSAQAYLSSRRRPSAPARWSPDRPVREHRPEDRFASPPRLPACPAPASQHDPASPGTPPPCALSPPAPPL